MTNQTRRNLLKSIPALSFAGATLVTSKTIAGLTPDERIKSALAEIESALQDKYPYWNIQVGDPAHETIMEYETGNIRNASEVLVIAAHEKHPLKVTYGFHKDYVNG